MSIGRFLIGFAAGGAVVFFATGRLERLVPTTIPSANLQSPVSNIAEHRVPVRVLSTAEMKDAGHTVTAASGPVASEAGPLSGQPIPQPPNDTELKARMARLGIPEPQAQAALEKLGPVKLGAVLEREEQKKAALEESARTAAATQAEASQSEQAPATAENSADVYQNLKDTYASNPPFGNEEELNEYRQDRFNQYVESVHKSEKEAFQDSGNGLACSGPNCLGAR